VRHTGTFFAEFLPAGLLDTHSPATAQTAGSSASSPKQPGTSAFAQAQPGSWQRQQAGSRSTRSRLTALGADRLRAGGAGAASIAQQPPPPPAPAAGASPTPLQQRQRHDQQQQQQQQQHQQQQQQQQHNAASSPAVVGAAGSFPRAHAAAPSTPAFFDAHSRAGSSAASSSSGEFVSGGDSDGDLFDFGLPTPGEVATRLGRALFGGDADDANDASSSGLDRWLPFGGPDGLRRRVSRGGGPGGLLPGWRLSSGGSGGVASRWAARHQPLRLKLAEQVVLGLGGFVAPPGSADVCVCVCVCVCVVLRSEQGLACVFAAGVCASGRHVGACAHAPLSPAHLHGLNPPHTNTLHMHRCCPRRCCLLCS
jgi:hypothetical protein